MINMNWNEIKWYFSKEHRLYAHKIYIDLGFHKLWKDWKEASKILDYSLWLLLEAKGVEIDPNKHNHSEILKHFGIN